MVNVQLLSDLHLEFHPDLGQGWLQQLDPSGVDVLVLAGDISLTREGMLCRALSWFCETYPEVVFVLGNHEFYKGDVQSTLAEITELNRQYPNLHWLENSTTTIKGQRFVGSTLWFPDGADGMNFAFTKQLNDFRLIGDFNPWVYQRNLESQKYLEDNVQQGDIVVTHHIPDIRGVAPRWVSDVTRFGRFFLSQLPRSVVETPRLWLFGHTHDSIDTTAGDCSLLCNPYGYYGQSENPYFNPKLVLSL